MTRQTKQKWLNLLATRELTAYRPARGRIVIDLDELDSFMRNSAKGKESMLKAGVGAGGPERAA
ncbi:MAG TPA: hypothetical protein VFE62_03805 [Gemmataceae bacterium]|nr:hypothetical protein [Gemmataceae bacterium]